MNYRFFFNLSNDLKLLRMLQSMSNDIDSQELNRKDRKAPGA